MVKHITLLPLYMKEFSCIGGDCEDTCCAGWGITLDKKTYKKYQKINHPELKGKLDSSMERIKNADQSGNCYAKIKLNSSSSCPMLTEDKWCQIQAVAGEQALSPTCTTYPRALNMMDQHFELSAKVSCPEVARLALLKEDGIDFEEMEFEINEGWMIQQKKSSADTSRFNHMFWPVRMFAIEIMQNRALPVCDRLIVLGLFVDKLQSEIELNGDAVVHDVIESYRSRLQNVQYLKSIQEIKVNIDVQIHALIEMVQFRYKHGSPYTRYNTCFDEMIAGFQMTSEFDNLTEISNAYSTNYKEYYLPFMEDKEYIFENYIVNYLYNTMFPNYQHKNLFNEYIVLASVYSMLKIHLIGISGYHKKLDTDIAIRTIQTYAKVVEHNNMYLNNILKLLANNNFNTMAHIATLVKDIK
ncbi:flagellin lysine-N-methylase [Paenibacillus sp. 481]|uniref:flagellin lysine-N-methylase n=1 Tax=Paenibacillus sp. 481 TaxID=2835869 RepID=UPI001E393CAC|nr:flagellin lysine-N-methylase [Paenibacillus sp. 481]UHA75719.1 flagellin lysine-N-methylase [Paenibacillus sp. 481]